MTISRWPPHMNMIGGLTSPGHDWPRKIKPALGKNWMTISPRRCQYMTRVAISQGNKDHSYNLSSFQFICRIILLNVKIIFSFNNLCFRFHRPWDVPPSPNFADNILLLRENTFRENSSLEARSSVYISSIPDHSSQPLLSLQWSSEWSLLSRPGPTSWHCDTYSGQWTVSYILYLEYFFHIKLDLRLVIVD